MEQFDFQDFLPWNEQGKTRSHVDILVRPDKVKSVIERLEAIKLPYQIIIENVQSLLDSGKNSAGLLLSPINDEGHRMTWDSYHQNEDINDYLTYLTKVHPDIVSLDTIGNSYEGRKMQVLKVCKGGCGNKPALWVDGGIHAREWISSATVTFLIRKLMEAKTTYTELIDKLDWYFLPVLNPDGKLYLV